MKFRYLLSTVLMLAAVLLAAGCSDDDNGTGPVDGETAATVTIDATDHENYAHFSLTTGTTVTEADDWHVAFRRTAIKLNGGLSATGGGSVQGANLDVVDYEDVSIDDTAGVTWQEDDVDYFMDEWYDYNYQTHELSANQYVYSMVDAEGDNYAKFQVDSIVGAGMPPDMGTVWLTYYYQPTAGSSDLSGATSTASITIGAGTGYFDFSSGSQVTPATPSSSTEWDIAFHSYNLMQNSGPNGTGSCAAFLAWGELTDPTDIDGFTTQPTAAPLFGDSPLSTMTEWYNYDGTTHLLTSKGEIYLLQIDSDTFYKVRIDSYYTNISGSPVSGYFTLTYEEL